ncbi:hypothetical protein [Mesotoga sp.]|uniref:hypothetical protein n=1 Tax=Mesotoga sp. TaxID=2053577 RepID=UPI00345E169E
MKNVDRFLNRQKEKVTSQERLEKTLDELGDLLDSFNTKYGELLKLSVEMDFKVEEV